MGTVKSGFRLLKRCKSTAICLLLCATPAIASSYEWHHTSAPGSSSRKLVADNSGNLWLATANTLSRWTGSGWQTETVTQLVDSNWQPNITFSSDNRPHIVYSNSYGHDVIYATKTSTGWQTEYITHNAADYACGSSIAIGPDDKVYSAIVTGTIGVNEKLELATRNSNGTWSTTVVDSSYRAAWWPSIKVNDKGTVNIAYTTGSTDDLKVATKKTDGAWTYKVLDSAGSTGWCPQIEIAENGLNRIGYLNQSIGKFGIATEQPDGTYTLKLSELTPPNGASYSLALDSLGSPLITYTKEDISWGGPLKCMWLKPTGTETFWVDNAQAFASAYQGTLSSVFIGDKLYICYDSILGNKSGELYWAQLPEPTSLLALSCLVAPAAIFGIRRKRR